MGENVPLTAEESQAIADQALALMRGAEFPFLDHARGIYVAEGHRVGVSIGSLGNTHGVRVPVGTSPREIADRLAALWRAE